jgi:DNA-3-methyladenine glycosylase
LQILPWEFYAQEAAVVARQLLGKQLIRETAEGVMAGMIVETEAYRSHDDPGCHAARGKTDRNAPMFERGGLAYVYFIYGMHHCFNVVTGPEGKGEAVLIRALAPLQGIPLMMKNRRQEKVPQLCNGPGKLCQAFGIDMDVNCWNLQQKPLYIVRGEDIRNVTVTTRIGLTRGSHLLLRYYSTGSPFVSRV